MRISTILTFLFGFFASHVIAQCENLNGDFESHPGASIAAPGVIPGENWINDNLVNWFPFHSSPDIYHDGTNNTIYMWSSAPTGAAPRGEGVFTNFDFISGTTYKLTYRIFKEPDALSDNNVFMARLANDLIPNTAGGTVLIPDFAGTEVVSEINWIDAGSWITITETFIAPADFNCLWFLPSITDAAAGYARCQIDDVCIEKLNESPCDFLPEMYRREGPCEWEFANTTTPPNSDYTILKTEWDFGDGTTGEGETVKHYYSSPGDYAVCMTVWMSYGFECCKKTVCYLVNVTEACSPCTVMDFADFDVSGTDTPNPVFNVTGIPESMTNVYGYYWEFGDGVETGTGETTSHTYENGNYTVCLTLFYFDPIKEECCSKRICKEISINFPGIRSNIPQPELSTRNESQTLKAIPNPNNGSFILNAQTEINSVHVYAPTGKLIYQTQNPNNTTIDLKGIEKGIYLVVINQNDYETRNFTKIIIE